MLSFGAGSLYGISSAANSTPRKLATLQDVQFDLSYSTKSLFGQNQVAVDIRRGQGKFTGKAKFAQINASALNDLFFGQAITTGLLLSAVGEVASIPAATPYTYNAVNSTTWDTDLGVVYAATGIPLTRVAAAPAQGQYSVAAGVYTFAAADAGLDVYIDYLYTSPTGGSQIALSNQTMGTTPTFKGVFTVTVAGKNITLVLNQCTSNKLSLQTKVEDYTIPELDLEVMADSGNNVGTLSITN
ncbi:MAG: hypothetical protein M0T84_17100 [Betaproteobacteria bacterium]|nr:hypothetical protein [Betaproteobacteria bacterium]